MPLRRELITSTHKQDTMREGGARSEQEPSSVCLAAMVREFMENEASKGPACNELRFAGSDNDDRTWSAGDERLEVLKGLVVCASKIERRLLALATTAVDEIMKGVRLNPEGGSSAVSFCRKLRTTVRRLKQAGFNAAICKSRWDHSGGIPAGEYEYIDVIWESERVILDTDFRAQFEVARPTGRYLSMLQILPPIFVGKSERLQQILNVMSNAARDSLKKKGLHLPPWRKPEYINAKWFSQYKRFTNEETQACRQDGNLDVKYTNELRILYEGRRKREVQDRCRSDQIVAMSSNWQPPAVNPRKPLGKPSRFAGLAAIFLEATG